jgi:hypothetical protein
VHSVSAPSFGDGGDGFQDIRKPLIMWFRAMWYVTSQKNGASALGIQRVLGLGSYQTAWTWLHKLRRAMVRPGRDKLSGWVEVDETYFGGLEEGKAGRGGIDKALIVIAAEADGKAIGRVRMRVIEEASADCLLAFVKDCIEPGSPHPYRWLAGLRGTTKQRLRSRGHTHPRTPQGRQQTATPCSSSGIAAETLAAGNPSRRDQPSAPAVLPRRIHFSVQSAKIEEQGQALLPPRRASPGNSTGTVPRSCRSYHGT